MSRSGESSINRVLLDTELRSTLLDQALELPAGLYADSFEQRGNFLAALKPLMTSLADSPLHQEIEALQSGLSVCLTVEGLPVDPELPPAPLDGTSPLDKQTFVSEGIALSIGQLLGVPSLIIGEKHEALVHQITPVRGRESSQSNEGTVQLMLHQDLAPVPDLPSMSYGRFMPEWLILNGVRSGSDVTKTYVAPLDDALTQIEPSAKDVLLQKRFVTNPPDSFLKERPGVRHVLPQHAVLTEYRGNLEACADYSSGLRASDPEDQEAIAAIAGLKEAFEAVKQEVAIEPGTAAIFNNRRITHGRSSIAQEENVAAKRWVQRTYVYDLGRVVAESLGRPWSISLGGGMVAITQSYPNDRLLELIETS